MREIILFLIIGFVTSYVSFGQEPLSGDYYIPKGANPKGFNTLSEAILALNANGASGIVKFLIDDNLSEDGTNLLINRSDLSSTNNLVIKPAPGKTPTITITNVSTASGANQYSGLSISNTSYVTIDGSNSDGGSTRDLTILMNSHSGRHGIQLYGNTDYITIKNVKIKYLQIGSTTSGNAIFVNGQSSGVADYCSIINCEIGENSESLTGPIFGISFTGYSGTSTYCSNGIISDNLIYARRRGINFFYGNGAGSTANINNNIISILNFASNAPGMGLYLNQLDGIVNVYNNKLVTLKHVDNSTADNNGNRGITGFAVNSTATLNIYNNFIGDFYFSGSNTSSTFIFGIWIATNGTWNIYHNTIKINTIPSVTGLIAGIGVEWGAPIDPVVNLKNNIIINDNSTPSTYGFYIRQVGLTFSLTSDYNCVYVPSGKFGNWKGSDQINIIAWQLASNQDANSISKAVTLVSSTDLHLSASSLYDKDLLGVPISGITKDIDGQDRHATAPYKGADEVVPRPIVIASKAFDAGGSWTLPGSVNFPVLGISFNVSTGWAKLAGLAVQKFVNEQGRTLATDNEVTLKAYVDVNENNQVDVNDTYLGSANFSADAAVLNFTSEQTINAGVPLRILLAIDVASNADPMHWIALRIVSPENVIVNSVADKSSDGYPIENQQDISLPVQVVNILSEVMGNVVKLKIRTQVEREDFVGFNVYRSRDGENYVLVGSYQNDASLKAKGNGAFGNEYEFVDKKLVESGKYYYKIEAVGRYEKREVGVVQVTIDVPKTYVLHQNYPNPFNPYTTISFELPVASSVRLELYNSAGQKVKDLFVGDLPAGYHEVKVDGRDLSSGVYFYVLKANDFVDVKKTVLLK